ncbi:hypothetical protein [Martelella mangrovi]|uniref:Deoxynucleotide monophosphate kinase n=1 Tax=Martelella mangrovi TaxID=1397477 RepID=A0ABV2IEX2_9HYPH
MATVLYGENPEASQVIIGLYSPQAGSGKSEAAYALINSAKFSRVRLAGALKEMLGALLYSMGFRGDALREMVDGRLKDTKIAALYGKSPRDLMISLGLKWGRGMVADTLWLDTARRALNAVTGAGASAVVDDIRFPNEAQMIRDMGGYLVKIERPSPSRDGGKEAEGQLGGWGFDAVITNDGTLEEFKRKVAALPQRLRRPD